MRKALFLIAVSLALLTGQAHAQRCLPKMKGIELRGGMADGFYTDELKTRPAIISGLHSRPTRKAATNGSMVRSSFRSTGRTGSCAFLWRSLRRRAVFTTISFPTTGR